MDLLSAWGIYTPLVLYLIAIILLVIEFWKSRSWNLLWPGLTLVIYSFAVFMLRTSYTISGFFWGFHSLFYLAMPLLLIIGQWWHRAKLTRPNHPTPFTSQAFMRSLYFLTLATMIAAVVYVTSFELRLCGRLDVQLQRSGCAGELRLGRQWNLVAAISPGDELLAAGGSRGTVSIFRIADLALVRRINAHIDDITGLDFSPDGKWLASASRDGTLRVWEMETGKNVYMFAASQPTSWPAWVAFSPDGSLLAALDGTGVQVWRLADRELVQWFPVHGWDFAFSPDSRQIAGAMEDESSIGIWQIEGGQLVTRLVGPGAEFTRIAYSPDGKLLASTGWGEDVIYLWQFEDQTVRTLPGSLTSTNIEFSPDGAYLFTSGDEVHTMGYTYLLQVWRVSDGTQLYVRSGFLDRVESIAVSPGGSLLALGSSTDFVWLWRVPPSVTEFD